MSDTPVTYTLGSVTGVELKADVYAFGEKTPRPVIVNIHGGALIFGSRSWVQPSLLELCRLEGYVLASVDYRLAPETKLPSILDDLQRAFRWVREDGPALFGADAERVVALGHSAGGYLSLLAGHRITPRMTAIVSYYGYGDIMGSWYSRPDPFYCTHPAVSQEDALSAVRPRPIVDDPGGRWAFYLYCRQHGCWPQEVMGANPDTAPEVFIPYCPERNVTPDYPPTMLLHGDQDTDVPYGLSVSMAGALARSGVPHEFITISGGGHGFVGDTGNLQVSDAEARVHAFLRKHLSTCRLQ